MKKVLLRLTLFAGLHCVVSIAEGRVFDINKESFAGYFAIGGGSSLLNTQSLSGDGDSGVSYSQKSQYSYQGEFGFLYSLSRLNLRFGIEILKPQELAGNASSSAGTLYAYNNTIMGFVPKLGLEFVLDRQATSRSFVGIGAGLADVKMDTSYVLTAAGQTAYAGVTDHSIEAKGTGTNLSASLGYEGLLTDSTTMAFEMGYRQLSIDKLKYSKAATTFTGAKVSGDTVLDADGNNRKLNMGGFFLALSFRFYL